jgi:hypothetical protein
VILTGDLNSPPTGKDSGAYGILTGKIPPVEVDKAFKDRYNPGPTALPDFKFLNTRAETPRFGVSGNFATFTGWSPVEVKEWSTIDFVFGGSNRIWYVLFVHLSRCCCGREGVGTVWASFDFALADGRPCALIT